MRCVLITGGSGGIGFACANRFTDDGWSAVIVDYGPNTIDWDPERYFQADVRDRDRADQIVSSLGRVDALVTCAGISKDASITRMDDEMWRQVIDVDLTGTFNYLAACAQQFRTQRSGKAVLVGSTLALRARRGVTNYVAAKAGVAGLAHGAARDLGRYDVNVNCVAPGLVDTQLTRELSDEVKTRLQDETCLGRLATPADIANVVHFLCTPAARHITGVQLRVDGGQLS